MKMNAEDREDETTVEYWKTRCEVLEKQQNKLKLRNSCLAKQNEETYQDNLRLSRITRYLKDKLKVSNRKGENNELNSGQIHCDLFFTFPEEVWPSVLTYLNDSIDLLNLCTASPFLNSILLQKEKPIWLFDQILPSIFKWITPKDMLECRLVCRKWNNAVLNYLDGYHSPLTSPQHQQCAKLFSSPPCLECSMSQNTARIWDSKLEPLDIDSTADLTTFLAEVKACYQRNGRTLLISRSLKLGLDVDSDENDNDMNDAHEFWESAIGLVHTIGRDIWHIEFFNDGFENDPSSFYGLFHQLLCHLPNLKTLRIICEFENNGEHFEQDDLVYRLGTWPMPCLTHLEALHVLHTMPSSMTAAIVSSYATQIRRFVISVAIFVHLEEEYLRGFVNLRELVLRDCVKDVQEFQSMLRRLGRIESPNLEKLRLFRSYSEEEEISTNYLFELVAEKFPKLQVLDTYRMEVSEENASHTYNNDGLSVYSLRTLKIRNSKKLSYNFLKKLPYLEELCIRDESNSAEIHLPYHNAPICPCCLVPFSIEDQNVEVVLEGREETNELTIDIKKFLYPGKIYESNIWDAMPSLKAIIYESFDEQVIPSGKYTREMLEFLKKAGKQD